MLDFNKICNYIQKLFHNRKKNKENIVPPTAIDEFKIRNTQNNTKSFFFLQSHSWTPNKL